MTNEIQNIVQELPKFNPMSIIWFFEISAIYGLAAISSIIIFLEVIKSHQSDPDYIGEKGLFEKTSKCNVILKDILERFFNISNFSFAIPPVLLIIFISLFLPNGSEEIMRGFFSFLMFYSIVFSIIIWFFWNNLKMALSNLILYYFLIFSFLISFFAFGIGNIEIKAMIENMIKMFYF